MLENATEKLLFAWFVIIKNKQKNAINNITSVSNIL